METDVIIVGKGISGLILSILLKQKNIDHVVLDRVAKRKTMEFPETLPPSALVLINSLGLLELFQKSSSKSFGYHSLWGSDTVTTNDFFNHNPYKYGLKLNKRELLNDLEQVVEDKLVKFEKLVEIKRSEKRVRVKIESNNESQTINGRVIVDATGRNRAVLKQLGVASEPFDNLVALSCHLPIFKHPRLIHRVCVESFDNGWGIVSSLNDQVNVMTLFTQKGNPILAQLKQYKHWNSILSNTRLLKDFLSEDTHRNVVGGDANSSKSSKITGPNWIAIGDAAISFDPLSSHGISNAIYCAKASSEAIQSHLNNDSDNSLQNCETTLIEIFSAYLKHKRTLYDAEKRWATTPFWRDDMIVKPVHS